MVDNFDWLKTLKPGDEVAVDSCSHWHRNDYKICKIEKITSSGRIKLSDGDYYHPNGRKLGGNYCRPLRQITPEILEIIERRKLISKLEFDKFKGKLNAERLNILLQWQEELLGDKG